MDWRLNYLKKYVSNKTVLDLGVGDISDRFLHKFINNHSKNCIGVELDLSRVKKLRDIGYNVIHGDAESISLNNSFDVVIAGDLIEHVNNVGIFLNNVRAHLKPSGVFLFNTPNAYSINFLLRGFFLFGNVKQFKEHIYLFNEDLINELMSRNGFKIKEVSYFTHHGSSISSLIIRFFSFFSKRWNENIMFRVVLEDD